MILLMPVVSLLIAAALVAGLHIWRPWVERAARLLRLRQAGAPGVAGSFSVLPLAWLVAVAGALGAWAAAWLLRQQIPLALPLAYWQPPTLFPASPALLLDVISWPFLMALATLCLAALLSMAAPGAPAQARPGSSDLLGSLALTVAAILAVTSANLLTLLLAWSALDLLELLTWLSRSGDRLHDRQSVMAYSARSIGLLLLIVGAVSAHADGLSLAVTLIRQPITPYLLAAAGLRLGVLPPGVLPAVQAPIQRSLRSLLLLAPAAANLVLVVRVAPVGLPAGFLSALFLVLSGLAAVYGGLSFARAANDLEAHLHWIPAMAALAVAAALRLQPQASLAWSLALLLPGGVICLLSARARGLLPLTLLGALGITALPFTPAWMGILLYKLPFSATLPLLLVGQALIMAGYLRIALRRSPGLNRAERWIWSIYPWSLALLALIQFPIAWWTRPPELPGWLISLVSVLIALLGLILLGLRRRLRRPPERMLNWLRTGLSFSWFYRLFWRAYFVLVRLFALASRILEGPGGVLWAILLLVLLVTILIQLGAGG